MLEAMDRDIFSLRTPTTFERRTNPPYWSTTIAMHWDGTYRDRVAAEPGQFWEHPIDTAQILAKHLADA